MKLNQQDDDDDDDDEDGDSTKAPKKQQQIQWPASPTLFIQKLVYTYYRNREGVADDLRAFLAFLAVAFTFIVLVEKATMVTPTTSSLSLATFTSFVNLLGENIGSDFESDTGLQLGTKATVAMLGILLFSILIALTERTISSSIDANITEGAAVMEADHRVIMGVFQSQRDIEGLWKVLQQMCDAYACEGGTSIVVLASRPKAEMEALCLSAIPRSMRHGTYIQFRRGSMLRPKDIERVAAAQAATVLVMSDYSRPPREADAQTLRCAVLLDEIVAAHDNNQTAVLPSTTTPSTVVCETQTGQGKRMIEQFTSELCQPLNENDFNALRLTRSIKNPIVAFMIEDLLGFDADDNLYTHDVERALVGMSFEQIQSHYPNEIVCGVCTRPSEEEMAETESANSETRWLHDVPPNVQHRKRQLECVDGLKLRLGVPHADWRATAGDRLLLLRSTQIPKHAVKALREPDPAALAALETPKPWTPPVSLVPSPSGSLARTSRPNHVLVVGWGNNDRMIRLLKLLDRGPCHLPPGSHVTLFHGHRHAVSEDDVMNNFKADRSLESFDEEEKSRTLAENIPALRTDDIQGKNDRDFVDLRVGQTELPVLPPLPKTRNMTIEVVRGDPLSARSMYKHLDLTSYDSIFVLKDNCWVDPDMNSSNGITYDNSPTDAYRLDALTMMAQLNVRTALHNQVESRKRDAAMECQTSEEVECSGRLSVADVQKEQSSKFRDALESSMGDALPRHFRERVGRGEEESSTLMVVQKVAFEGVTRFEDRSMKAIGMSFQEVAARMLVNVQYDCILQQLFMSIGIDVEWDVEDVSRYAAPFEKLTFWDVMARARADGKIALGYYDILLDEDGEREPMTYHVNPRSSSRLGITAAGWALIRARRLKKRAEQGKTADEQELEGSVEERESLGKYSRMAVVPPLWMALQKFLRKRRRESKEVSKSADATMTKPRATVPSVSRDEVRVWNRGDGRTRLIVLASKTK